MVSSGSIMAAPTEREIELMVLGTEARIIADQARAFEERLRSLEALLAESRQRAVSLDAAVQTLDRALADAARAASAAAAEHSSAIARLDAQLHEQWQLREDARQDPRVAQLEATLKRRERDLVRLKREAEVMQQWIDQLHARAAEYPARGGLLRPVANSLARRLPG